MTSSLKLNPVYYPATFLRRRSLPRLAYLFGTFGLLQPPGLSAPGARDGLGSVVEQVALSLPQERVRLIEAVLADYLAWAAAHQGGTYALYVEQRRRAREESLHEVKRALRGAEAAGPGAAALPEDAGWQVFLRLAHDYDRQQEEIEELLARVRERERDLAGLTGLDLDEAEAGPAVFERPEQVEVPHVSDDLTPGGRMAAFGHLWLAARVDGTPVTESFTAHDHLLQRAAAWGIAEEDTVQFRCELPDAARLSLGGALERRAEVSGALDGFLARLSALQALLRARSWSDEVRATVDLLVLETREQGGRVCREAEVPSRRLHLRGAVIPRLSAERFFARVSGRPEPDDGGGSGLYLLVEGAS